MYILDSFIPLGCLTYEGFENDLKLGQAVLNMTRGHKQTLLCFKGTQSLEPLCKITVGNDANKFL